jgi:hypothetical protein
MRIRSLVAGRCVVLAGLAVLAWAHDSEAILIDDFSTGQSLVLVTPATSASSQVSGPGILGGERDIVVTLASDFLITMIASGDSLTYGHVGSDGNTGLIVWDGPDNDPKLDPIGLGGVDFTMGGVDDEVGISLLASNILAPITLTAYTNADDFSTATVPLPGNVPPQARLSVSFTDFVADPGGSGADFTDIGAFSLYIDGNAAPGLAVRFGIVNPEPSTATLLLLGILMLAGIRGFRWAP